MCVYIGYDEDENRMNNEWRILTEALELMGYLHIIYLNTTDL